MHALVKHGNALLAGTSTASSPSMSADAGGADGDRGSHAAAVVVSDLQGLHVSSGKEVENQENSQP